MTDNVAIVENNTEQANYYDLLCPASKSLWSMACALTIVHGDVPPGTLAEPSGQCVICASRAPESPQFVFSASAWLWAWLVSSTAQISHR